MKTLREQYAEIREQALAIPKAAEADGRKDLTDEEMGRVTDLLAKAEELQPKIKKADADAKTMKALGDLPDLQDPAAAAAAVAKTRGGSGAKSLGEMFVSSDEYSALKQRYPNGFPDRAPVQMDPVQIGGFSRASEGKKDLIFVGDNTNTDSQFPGVAPDFRGIVMPTFAPLSVRQLFSAGSTQGDLIEYVREIRSDRELAAAAVPEARSKTDDAALKPESTVKFERVSTPVKTIAHWMGVTKKALADIGQVRTLIDTFLSRGLDEELEHQLVNGDGTGENLLGIGNDPDLTTVAFDTDLLTTARKAKTALYVMGVQPNAILMNPEDDEAVDLLKDGVERFYGNGPFGLGPQTLWALPRVWSNQVTKGEAFVGDFRTGVIYDREAATIQTGTVDDQFIRNQLTILAEMRVAFAVWEPFKIARVDLGTEAS
jgi:HK97 family phage major capsid protein